MTDLRPGALRGRPEGVVVVSGPDDLAELRVIVEAATGVGTWPRTDPGDGELLRAEIVIDRPAPILALLLAMESLIEDRSPWRTWRTAVETLAGPVSELRAVTVEAVVIAAT